MGADGDYCSYTKAVEHLGDRWSLVILRDLVLHESLGFNALAAGLPGISRSVLAARLRKLEELGLVTHSAGAGSRSSGYRPTGAGLELMPVIQTLWTWSKRWVPEDVVWAERDPDIVMPWLARRVDRGALPNARVVVQLDIAGTNAARGWLVLERAAEPAPCLEDPCLPAERYVYVESHLRSVLPLARGVRDWADAIADGSVRIFGEPDLVGALPGWFVPAGAGVAADGVPA